MAIPQRKRSCGEWATASQEAAAARMSPLPEQACQPEWMSEGDKDCSQSVATLQRISSCKKWMVASQEVATTKMSPLLKQASQTEWMSQPEADDDLMGYNCPWRVAGG